MLWAYSAIASSEESMLLFKTTLHDSLDMKIDKHGRSYVRTNRNEQFSTALDWCNRGITYSNTAKLSLKRALRLYVVWSTSCGFSEYAFADRHATTASRTIKVKFTEQVLVTSVIINICVTWHVGLPLYASCMINAIDTSDAYRCLSIVVFISIAISSVMENQDLIAISAFRKNQCILAKLGSRITKCWLWCAFVLFTVCYIQVCH